MIEFAGDNPCVVLYDEAGNVCSAASYWNSNAGLGGVGQVLFLISRANGTSIGRIFSDSPNLAEFCTTFNKYFSGFEDIAWNVSSEAAQMEMVRGNGEFTLTCTHGAGAVSVSWRDLDVPYINRALNTDFGNEKGRTYEVSCVIIPAKSGEILVDGVELPGTVVAPYGGLPRSSFLAFCETWTRVQGDTP